MVGDPKEQPRGGDSCEAVEGGYTIFLDGETIRSFMEAADYSSARELDHFREVGAQIEKRIRTGSGLSILALAEAGQGLTRDFTVLQMAHILAKHGRNVLIVDCDFLHPSLSGLVENIEDVGFLDLLLYGSSLKSVARGIGIDGVSVAGPGSFPVSRTVPFALKEFGKIKEFLAARHDIVIYCSTLHAEDGGLTPLASLVDGIVLCCRIDEMAEGELQKNLRDLGAARVPPVELVCFCRKREHASARPPASAPAAPAVRPAEAPPRGSAKPATIEKTEELDVPPPKGGKRGRSGKRASRISLLRIVTVSVVVLIVAFFVWWTAINRSVKQRGRSGTAGELVQTEPRMPQQAGEALAPADTAAMDTAAASPGGASPPSAQGPEGTGAAPPGGTARTPGRETEAQTGSGAVEKPAVPSATARYTIHVASFKEMARANVEKTYLERNNYTVTIVTVEIKGEQWLRVLAGAYATKEEADRARLAILALPKIGYARVVTFDQASSTR